MQDLFSASSACTVLTSLLRQREVWRHKTVIFKSPKELVQLFGDTDTRRQLPSPHSTSEGSTSKSSSRAPPQVLNYCRHFLSAALRFNDDLHHPLRKCVLDSFALMPNLMLLDLSFCSISLVNDENLNLISELCPQINSLSIEGCNKAFSGESVQWKSPLWTRRLRLKSFNAVYCESITDPYLMDIISTSSFDIETLLLEGCCGIKDSPINGRIYCCPKLKRLSFDGSGNTDNCLPLVSGDNGKSQVQLQELHIQNCTKFTDEFLVCLLPFLRIVEKPPGTGRVSIRKLSLNEVGYSPPKAFGSFLES